MNPKCLYTYCSSSTERRKLTEEFWSIWNRYGWVYPSVFTSMSPTVSLQRLVLQYSSYKLEEGRRGSIYGAVDLAKSFIQYRRESTEIAILQDSSRNLSSKLPSPTLLHSQLNFWLFWSLKSSAVTEVWEDNEFFIFCLKQSQWTVGPKN